MILEEARKRIDDLNEEANRLKMGVLRDAQAQANAKVEAITEQVAAEVYYKRKYICRRRNGNILFFQFGC